MKISKKTARRIRKVKINNQEIEQAMKEFATRKQRRLLTLAHPAAPQSPGGIATAAARTATAAETGRQPLSSEPSPSPSTAAG